MGLLVWLPLTEDAHNQGASSIEVALPTCASLDTTGKIGQCYSLASGNYLGLDAKNVNNHKYSPISLAL